MYMYIGIYGRQVVGTFLIRVVNVVAVVFLIVFNTYLSDIDKLFIIETFLWFCVFSFLHARSCARRNSSIAVGN